MQSATPQANIPPSQPAPAEHELDFLIVHNPDVNCDDIDTELGWNHKEYFEVRWGKQPHRIKPGETRIMPRFLAKHFAKHLANHILMKREETEKKRGLVQSPVERPKLLAQILLGVQQYYLTEGPVNEGEKVAQMVEQANPQERTIDIGKVVDPTLGVLKPEGPGLEQIMKAAGKEEALTAANTPPPAPMPPKTTLVPTAPKPAEEPKTSLFDPGKPKPTKAELLKAAFDMGIDITGRETVDQLINKIKKF